MAITAQTRTDIIGLVVTAYNQAPGTTLLSDLVAIVDGGGTLADVAASLTASASFKATYPTFQTPAEFGAELLGNLVPLASEAARAEGISIIESVLNGGGTRADVIMQATTFLANLSVDDPAFGSSAGLFTNRVAVAEYHTVTLETAGSSSTAFDGVTDNPATVDTAKSKVDGTFATYTLSEALAVETLPALYDISDASIDFGTVTVAAGAEAIASVTAIISGAANSADLTLAATWNISDSAANILAGDVSGATTVSVTDTVVTPDQAAGLAALANFDGNTPPIGYSLAEAIAADTLADSYQLSDAAADLGEVTVADAATQVAAATAIIAGATNAADLTAAITYSILDSAANVLAGDVSGATTVSVNDTEITLTQRDALLALDNFNSASLPGLVLEIVPPLNASEGSTAEFTLSGAAAETEVAYKISGVSAADIDGGQLLGTVTTDANGQATISIPLVADRTTEGEETLTVTLVGSSVTASTVVADTSPDPVLAAATATDEGSTAEFALTGAAPNTTINYTISGVDAADVTGGLTGSVTTDANGAATISVAAAADRTTEGEETMTVTLDGTTVSATGVINDTSLDNVAPTATAGTAAVGEDDAAISGQLVATDDADGFTFAVDTAVEGLTVNADGSYTFDPSANTAASALVYTDNPLDIVANITVTDSDGATTPTTLTITVTPTALSYSMTADKTQVKEGATATYSITASEAVTTDTTATFTLVPADGAAANAGTNNTNTSDFAQGAFNPTDVVIAAGSTTATFEVSPTNDATTELPEAYSVTGSVAGQTFTVAGSAIDDPAAAAGQSFTLTTAIDTIPGLNGSGGTTTNTGDNEISGVYDKATTANTTLNALDNLDGGTGTDTLKVNFVGSGTNGNDDNEFQAFPSGVTAANIETLTIRAAGDIGVESGTFLDLSSFSFTTINVTTGDDVSVKAATTADVNYSGLTGLLEVDGGKDVTITDSTAAKNIAVGAASQGAGAISITDSNQTSGIITADGGSSVSISATSANATSGAITVSDTATRSGAVTVNQTVTNNGVAAVTMGDVTVTGGSTVTVNSTGTNTSSTGNANNITAPTIKVTGTNNTTAVTVTQTQTATDTASSTTGATKETSTVTVGALKTGESILIGETGGATGDTDFAFTASKDLTAAEVAAAIANLTSGDQHGSAGTTNGFYTGTLDAGWTSGAADGAVVVFTATTTGDKTNLEVYTDSNDSTTNDAADNAATNDATFKQVIVAGSAGTTAAAADVTATDGDVRVDEGGTSSITTVTLSGFANADIGNTGADLDSLTTLNLTDGAGNTNVATAATTLTMNLNNHDSATDIDKTGATVTTLTLNGSGSTSTFGLTAAAVTTLTIDAGASIDIDTGSTLSAIKTVNVSGSSTVSLGDISGTTETISGASATGSISATIDGTKATVTTGSGADTITSDTATPTKNISLGAGNDTLNLATGTVSSTGTLDGGDGTGDILGMDADNAATAGGSTTLAGTVNNFEILKLNTTAGDNDTSGARETVTINLENLDFTNSVISAGTTLDGTAAQSDVLSLTNFASGGTLTINASPATDNTRHSVTVKDSATGSSDTFNHKTTTSGDLDFGETTIANVETVNIEADDTTPFAANGTNTQNTHTLDVVVDTATTINVTGDAHLTLDATSDANLVTVNASGSTGIFTYNANGTKAQTVTGGSAADALTATGASDVLIGGAGNDALTGANLTTLTGGDGNDEFIVNIPSNVNQYSTITDFSAGDKIQLTAGETFVSSAITVADTAVFQDIANTAVNQLATDDEDAAWFQFDGNTYIVINDDQADLVTADFESGADAIIRITGLVDLGANASYNQTTGELTYNGS